MKSYNVVLANMDFETVRKDPCDAEVRGYQVGGMMNLSVRMEVICLDFQRSDEIVRSNVYSPFSRVFIKRFLTGHPWRTIKEILTNQQRTNNRPLTKYTRQ